MSLTSPVPTNGISVAARLWISVGVVIAALVFLIGFSALRNNSLQRDTAAVTQALETKQGLAERWANLSAGAVLRVQASVISSDPTVNETYKEEVAAAIQEINKVQKAIEAMDLSDADKAVMAQIAERRKGVLAASNKAIELRSANNSDGAKAEVKTNFNPAVASYLGALNDFVALQDKQKTEARAALAERRGVTTTIAMVLTVVIGIGLLVGAAWLVRSIQNPLSQALRVAHRISEGDLTVTAHSTSRDEFGQLLNALDLMANHLRKLVGEVRQGVDSVSTAAGEIATGNHDLSARTEQTASNLQQTASSMEELTATVSQSADTARQATQLATSAAEAAQRGGSVVTQVTDNMNEITASSRKISDIIGVIDGIAFQTNILALNAAVEAARAGEQGRGFAVVAGEVRTLAQRSAEAAKEIKALISASVERVETGAELVAQSGAVMQDIVSSVSRVSDLIGEISAASTEQRDGIGQVNQAVTQLDQMTQQNAALVEESAAAAQSMREQAQRLMQVVSQFNVGSGSSSGAIALSPSKPVASLPPRAAPAGAKVGKPAGASGASATAPAKTATASPPPAAAKTGTTGPVAAAQKPGASPVAAAPRPAAPAKAPAAKPPAPAPRPPAEDDSGDWETF